MSDNAKLEGPQSEFLMIPLNKERLGTFLSSLLGQPQSIDRRRFGTFNIELPWIRELLDTIHLRITRQAKANRLSFSAEIGYSDGEIRTISSYEELMSYNELFPRFTLRIKVRFSYLIEFPGKDVPERQDFELVVDESPSEQEKSGSILSGIIQKEVGSISYRIYYTERTWGDDIDKIFSEYLDKAFTKVTKRQSYARLVFMLFSTLVSSLCLYAPMISQMTQMLDNSNKLVDKLKKSFADTPDWKIDYLYQINSQRYSTDGLSFLPTLVALGAAVLILFLSTYLMKRSSPSFVCLTENDRGYRKITLERRNRRLGFAVAGYVLSIVAGVISSYAYKWLTTGSL